MDDNYIYSLGRDGVLGKMSLVTENIRTSENARANEYVFHLSMLILFACVRVCVCACVCVSRGEARVPCHSFDLLLLGRHREGEKERKKRKEEDKKEGRIKKHYE